MAFKSEQARVLNRQLIGGLIRNLAIFTAVLAAAAVIYQVYFNPAVAEYVADRTAPWHAIDSSSQFNATMADLGYLDNDVFQVTVDTMSLDGYSAEAGSGGALTSDDLAAALVRCGLYEHFLVDVYSGSTASLQEAAEGEYAVDSSQEEKAEVDVALGADEGEDHNAYGNYSLPAQTTADAEDVAELAMEDEERLMAIGEVLADVYDIDTATWNTETITQILEVLLKRPELFNAYCIYVDSLTKTADSIMETVGLTRSESSVQQLCAAYVLACLLDESDITADVPPDIATNTLWITLTQVYNEGTQEELDSLINDVYLSSQDRAFDAVQNMSREEQQEALHLTNDNFELDLVRNPAGTYYYRDVSVYKVIKSFKLPLLILIFVVGWFVIVSAALRRSLRYFDDLSNAVAGLLSDRTAAVKLPKSLAIAQNELAVIRAQSLADERAAKAAEQRKNELVAYLAHDIRTPLTSVLGYLDLLRETTDLPRETQRKYSDIAYQKAERLEDLINEFFEITRYNLSAIPIERETVGVKLFCEQIAESFYPEALAHSVDISISVQGGETFFVDPDKLARAVGNVMRNALSYAEPHSTVKLSARDNGQATIITITNHGREISEAHLETIFEKFYREDGSRSSRSGGAGLGLAIAREIVTAHEGTIFATSEDGVTTFTIEIPHRRSADAASRAAASPATGREERPTSPQRTVPTRRIPRHGRPPAHRASPPASPSK